MTTWRHCYEGALCLAFPSKTEGFGIPALEAMARSCPVISSNAASLVEVGGDAVIYVDPDHGDGWRDAIIGLSRNDGASPDDGRAGAKESYRILMEAQRAVVSG